MPIDWVLHKGKPCRVWCIDWQYQLVRCHSNGQEWNCSPDEIEPIPITMDILTANGFKKEIGDGRYKCSLCLEENIDHPEYDIKIWFTSKGDVMQTKIQAYKRNPYPHFCDIHLAIESVHELQHVLRSAELWEIADNIRVVQ